MKVICIATVNRVLDNTGKDYDKICNRAEQLIIGNEYTVIDIFTVNKYEFYRLEEKPFYMKYDSRLFATLESDVDELVIQFNKEKENIHAFVKHWF